MIRTRQQGDNPFFPNMLNNGAVEVCLKEDVDKVINEKDKEIAVLKAQIAEAKELSILLQKRNKAIADNAISNVESYKSKRDAEIESLKASHYAEMVDAGMRERRLRRALYKACAMWAKSFKTTAEMLGAHADAVKWDNVERKCRVKAELYK